MTREAIESLGVVQTLHMSGARATFTVARGSTVTEARVRTALEAKNLQLESFATERRPRPEVCYVATVTGLG